jgi:MauM/NapG family ferredoxin protein
MGTTTGNGELSSRGKPATNHRKWRLARRFAQIIVLLLFFYLILTTRQEFQGVIPPGLFFYLSPLAGIALTLASRSFIPLMGLGIITLISALILGRVWCGWVCPLGTVIDCVPTLHSFRNHHLISSIWRNVKYVILFGITLIAMMGSLAFIFLDPITLFSRSVVSTMLPALSFVVITVEKWLYIFSPLQPAIDWIEGSLRAEYLPERTLPISSMLPFLLLVFTLALSMIKPRFWCRFLCPLGALLALTSRFSHFRHNIDTDKCIACGKCAENCPTGAIDREKDFLCNQAECISCINCAEQCPVEAIRFEKRTKSQMTQVFSPSRRELLTALGFSALGVALFRFLPVPDKNKMEFIRPPGATEDSLLNKCIRCGECYKVCPTGSIQPVFSTNGREKIWTPGLSLRHGYCDYSCNSCGMVCPTGAITKLALSEKRQKVIGIAKIDEERCLPYKEGRDCIVCEEMCPVPDKAIILEEKDVITSGGIRTVRLPKVVNDKCIGCGICEYQCPLQGNAAIAVQPGSEV